MRLFRRGESAPSLDLLVAGLGNPGKEYARTRHNVGHMVVDELARRHGASFRSKFSGDLTHVRLDEARIALLKPQTYMNESGRSVGAAVRFYKPARAAARRPRRGRPRARPPAGACRGGLAGHNGLRSLGQHLGSQVPAPARRRGEARARRSPAGCRLGPVAVRRRGRRRRARREGRGRRRDGRAGRRRGSQQRFNERP